VRRPILSAFAGGLLLLAAGGALAQEAAPAAGDAPPDPAATPGTQSFLIETGNDRSGGVPALGTLTWSEGHDALGAPTLIAHAEVPDRGLGVDIILGRNADTTLPASHILSVTFTVTPGFGGGAVASLRSITLKDQPLVQGLPLAGAAARILDNSFLFALSDAPKSVLDNVGLLARGRWIDMALVYANGRQAVLTLEKDADTDALFRRVLTDWNLVAIRSPVAFYASEDATVVTAIQQVLQDAGCNPGGVDGKWGVNSRSALARFGQVAGFDIGGAAPTAYMLIALRSAPGTNCTGQSQVPAEPAPTATAEVDPKAPVPAPPPSFR
jgi:hypothetical protein